MNTNEKITILIAAKYPLLKVGLKTLISAHPEFEVVAETCSLAETIIRANEIKPQVVIASYPLLTTNRELIDTQTWNKTSLVVIVPDVRESLFAEILNMGAVGYLTSSDSVESITSTLQRASRGEILFTSDQYNRARYWRDTVSRKIDNLTAREQEVLQKLAEGKDNRSISEDLGISYKTTAFHITHILNKLGVTSRQEAISWLYNDYHLIKPDDMVGSKRRDYEDNQLM